MLGGHSKGIEVFLYGQQGSLSHQSKQVRWRISFTQRCVLLTNIVQGRVLRAAHRCFRKETLENGFPLLRVRRRNVKQPVKATRPQDGEVQAVRSIGRPNNRNSVLDADAVYFHEKLSEDAILGHVRGVRRPDRHQTIDFVNEYDRRRSCFGTRKDCFDCFFAFAHVLIEQLGAFYVDEVQIGLRRDRFHEHGLAATRRAIQKDSLQRLYLQSSEQVFLRLQSYYVVKLLLQLHPPPYVVPLDIGNSKENLSHRRGDSHSLRCQEMLTFDKQGVQINVGWHEALLLCLA
mmetsp:Transcript_10575/g.19919  ORF Transcript_10575/g.19919 Transcript_10575/m.19919 type:complete len:289 (+) Transcript_10575:171-1037(+)